MKKPICINIYRKNNSFICKITFEKNVRYSKEYSKDYILNMKKQVDMFVQKNQIKDFLKDYENIISRDNISPTILYIIIIDMLVSFERWLVK